MDNLYESEFNYIITFPSPEKNETTKQKNLREKENEEWINFCNNIMFKCRPLINIEEMKSKGAEWEWEFDIKELENIDLEWENIFVKTKFKLFDIKNNIPSKNIKNINSLKDLPPLIA